MQSGEPNHSPGPVPVADIRRRLFGWEAESWQVYARKPDTDTLHVDELLAQPDRDAMISYILDALGLQGCQHLRPPRGIVRGAERAERNMLNAVTGRTDDLDQQILATLAQVLGKPLALAA